MADIKIDRSGVPQEPRPAVPSLKPEDKKTQDVMKKLLPKPIKPSLPQK